METVFTILMILVAIGLLVNLILDIITERWLMKRCKKEYEMLIKRIEDECNGSDSKV